jgi:hypothetical protein
MNTLISMMTIGTLCSIRSVAVAPRAAVEWCWCIMFAVFIIIIIVAVAVVGN